MNAEPIRAGQSNPEPEHDGIIDFAGLRDDVSFVLHAPLRHPRIAAGCLAFVLVVAAASSLVFRDIYQVQASLLAQRNPVMLVLSNPGLARGADWDAPTRAARETVLRRDNLIALCEQTGFVDRYLANRSPLGRFRAGLGEYLSGKKESRADIKEGLADTLQTKLWVSVGPEGTVTFTFEWPDKEIAYQVVEAAMQNFLEARHASEVSVLGDSIALLEASATKLQRELDTSLTDVERKERARPRPTQRRAVSPAVSSNDDEEVARLKSTLVARKRALVDLEEFRQRRLAELNSQLAQKEAIYAERHPEVVSTKQSIAGLLQTSPSAEGLRLEIKELEKALSLRGVVGAAAAAGNSSADFPAYLLDPRAGLEGDDVRYEYDRSRLRFLREQYSSVLQRLSSAKLELETAQAAFKYRYSVITPPAYPKGPKRPYTLLRILGGLFGGVALALFVCTAVDLKSGRIHEEWEIRRHLGLPVLGRLPR
jgi:uncharacterized protein involved in exopolysaccharide biosynthesis